MSTTDVITKKPATNYYTAYRWYHKFLDCMQPFIGRLMADRTLVALVNQLTAIIVSSPLPDKDGPVLVDADCSQEGPTPREELFNRVVLNVRSILWQETAGLELTPDLAGYIALRMGGNNIRLRYGGRLPAWRGQPKDEWAVAEIVDARWHQTPKRKLPGANLRFVIWSGWSAGHEFEQFFTDAAMSYMARKIGLRDRKDYWRLIHYRELVRMKLLLFLPEAGELRAQEYKGQPSLNTKNRALMQCRGKKIDCAYSEITVPCHFCPHGYGVCHNGTHPDEYETGMCVRKHRGWMHPLASAKGYCLRCQAGKWIQRVKQDTG